MHTLNYPETTKWVVAHNNDNVFHVSEVKPNNCLLTGEPFMEVFDSKEEMLTSFPQLSSNINFQQDDIEEKN
jgi:hypothetical protein